ncbi:hypothetical protein MRB53_040200 [Persea americana]|nr:hypothetical protein MRB53_040200 [Persea americana]
MPQSKRIRTRCDVVLPFAFAKHIESRYARHHMGVEAACLDRFRIRGSVKMRRRTNVRSAKKSQFVRSIDYRAASCRQRSERSKQSKSNLYCGRAVRLKRVDLVLRQRYGTPITTAAFNGLMDCAVQSHHQPQTLRIPYCFINESNKTMMTSRPSYAKAKLMTCDDKLSILTVEVDIIATITLNIGACSRRILCRSWKRECDAQFCAQEDALWLFNARQQSRLTAYRSELAAGRN